MNYLVPEVDNARANASRARVVIRRPVKAPRSVGVVVACFRHAYRQPF